MKTRFSRLFLIRLISIFILSPGPLLLFSQETTSCAENLKSAQALFGRGQVEKVPAMLYDCMKSGFKREEQLAAYKLLIQSYLLQDKLSQADSAMLTFLKRYPEYQLSPTDHSSFVNLFNSYNVRPVVQIALHLGTNVPFLTGIVPRSVSSEPHKTDYSIGAFNLYASLEAKYLIRPRLELNIEGAWSQAAFTRTENILDFGLTTYTETQSRLEFPVTVTYDYATFGKFTAYARAGGGAALDLASSATALFDPSDPNNFENVEGPDLSRNDSRIFMDIFIQAGAGIKFKTPRGFINLEIRSNLGLIDQNVPGSTSPEMQSLIWDYYYIDDDFRLNTLNITLGYTQIFYKSSRRK